MTVHPHLFNHPRFLGLKREIKKDAAEYLLRIWGHCQENCRRENWGPVGADYVETICHWRGTRGVLVAALQKWEWIKIEDKTVIICHWDAHNRALIAKWRNGKLGGRPPQTESEPEGSEQQSDCKPIGSQSQTDCKPSGNSGTGTRSRTGPGSDSASVTHPPANLSDSEGGQKKDPAAEVTDIALERECSRRGIPIGYGRYWRSKRRANPPQSPFFQWPHDLEAWWLKESDTSRRDWAMREGTSSNGSPSGEASEELMRRLYPPKNKETNP